MVFKTNVKFINPVFVYLNMKCSKCGKKVETIFLGKIKGTYVGKRAVCSECQKKPQ